jgi:hypothetical protein
MASIISERVTRPNRSSYVDKRISHASSQYIKSWQEQYHQRNHRQVHMNMMITKLSVSLMDELSHLSLFREIVRLTIDRFHILSYVCSIDLQPVVSQKQIFCSMEHLQIDNQCYNSKNNFDFPVVLMSKQEQRTSKVKMNVVNKQERHEYVMKLSSVIDR